MINKVLKCSELLKCPFIRFETSKFKPSIDNSSPFKLILTLNSLNSTWNDRRLVKLCSVDSNKVCFGSQQSLIHCQHFSSSWKTFFQLDNSTKLDLESWALCANQKISMSFLLLTFTQKLVNILQIQTSFSSCLLCNTNPTFLSYINHNYFDFKNLRQKLNQLSSRAVFFFSSSTPKNAFKCSWVDTRLKALPAYLAVQEITMWMKRKYN